MMISTIDVETSYQKTESGGMDPLPFNPKNTDNRWKKNPVFFRY